MSGAGLTGVDDPYEPPVNPEVTLDTSKLSVQECVDRIIDTLDEVDVGLMPQIRPLLARYAKLFAPGLHVLRGHRCGRGPSPELLLRRPAVRRGRKQGSRGARAHLREVT